MTDRYTIPELVADLKVTVSLHIYGKHINLTGRSQFDPEKRTETPFILKWKISRQDAKDAKKTRNKLNRQERQERQENYMIRR